LAALTRQSAEVGIGWVSGAVIDQVGLTRAQELAMGAALAQISRYDRVIMDGSINYLPNHHVPIETMVKADQSVPAVSAAAIIAKTARDNFMKNVARCFPEYGFGVHVGYGTAYHRQQLERHGVTPLHRLSFKPVGRIAAQPPL
jgi:ribonuclease HII